MRVSRRTSVRIQYILDQSVPPRVRDSQLFMYLPMKLVLKDATHDFMHFSARGRMRPGIPGPQGSPRPTA
jgi:hypothetical protein